MRSLPAVLFLAAAALAAAAGPSDSGRHVVLITIDGMAAYNLDDDSLVAPNIRELARAGTEAESSETIFPSVTHPSHTTIVTGALPMIHGVLGNSMRDRTTGRKFNVSSAPHAEAVHAPTIFDAAKKKKLTTAAFAWPESRDDPALDWNLPDGGALDPGTAQEFERWGRPLRLNPEYHHDIVYQGATDRTLAEAAAEIIRQRRPNLLAIHFLKTDVVQHRYGPGHYLSKAAITETDRHIGLLRDAVREAGIERSTTFVVTADHGFQAVYEEINLHGPFAEADLTGKVRLYPDKWVLHVERSAAFTAEDEPRLARALARIAALPGIARVIQSAEYPSLGFPRYEDNAHVRGQYMIVANIEYHLTDDASSVSAEPRRKSKPYFGHGYLPQHPRMYPPLILSGRAIVPGKRIGHVKNVDIAPTIAWLLDLEWSAGPGSVLKEALAQPE